MTDEHTPMTINAAEAAKKFFTEKRTWILGAWETGDPYFVKQQLEEFLELYAQEENKQDFVLAFNKRYQAFEKEMNDGLKEANRKQNLPPDPMEEQAQPTEEYHQVPSEEEQNAETELYTAIANLTAGKALVVFGLPDRIYRNVPFGTLGGTDVSTIVKDGLEMWYQKLHPAGSEEEEDESKKERVNNSLLFGHAIHTFCLEGEEAFRKIYAPKPTPKAGEISSMDDARKWLRAVGEKPEGAKTRDQMMARVREVAAVNDISLEGLIFADRLAAVERLVAKNGGQLISERMFNDVLRRGRKEVQEGHPQWPNPLSWASTGIDGNPQDYPLVEVSFFWRDKITGLLCRGRVDGLTRSGRVLKVLELKSFFRPDTPTTKIIAGHIWRWGYFHQAKHYETGMVEVINAHSIGHLDALNWSDQSVPDIDPLFGDVDAIGNLFFFIANSGALYGATVSVAAGPRSQNLRERVEADYKEARESLKSAMDDGGSPFIKPTAEGDGRFWGRIEATGFVSHEIGDEHLYTPLTDKD